MLVNRKKKDNTYRNAFQSEKKEDTYLNVQDISNVNVAVPLYLYLEFKSDLE